MFQVDYFHVDKWTSAWLDSTGKPVQYSSKQAATKALREYAMTELTRAQFFGMKAPVKERRITLKEESRHE